MPNIVLDNDLRGRIEDALHGRDIRRIAFGLGAVVIVALFLWGRGATARIAPPAPIQTAGSAALALPTPTPAVLVDVAGAVRAPGLYSLPAGARVADALTAARGPRRRADLTALNLAQIVADGTKIVVPARGAPSAVAVPQPGQSSMSSGATVVPLNSADQSALETVPGIGPVTAMAILAHRDRIGGFSSIDQLLEVDGIGPATLAQIRSYLTI